MPSAFSVPIAGWGISPFPTLQQWRYANDYIDCFWKFQTNGLPLEQCFQWAASVSVTKDSWLGSVSTSFQSAFFESGDGELCASVTSATGDVLRDNTVEVVYHRTCRCRHDALALMCQKCKFVCQIQMEKGAQVPLDKLQVVRRALACWLGIVAPASAVDGGY